MLHIGLNIEFINCLWINLAGIRNTMRVRNWYECIKNTPKSAGIIFVLLTIVGLFFFYYGLY